jgi:phage-related protein (TIGR01555 family)
MKTSTKQPARVGEFQLSAPRIVRVVKDGWNNLLTGLGGSRDKSKYTQHRFRGLLPDEELESLYIEDGLATRIVDLLVQDMFREGWKYTFPDMDDIEADETEDVYKEVMEDIQAATKLKEALSWARLYGGAIILIGALDGRGLDTPLLPAKIRTFDTLRIIDRSDIEFSKIKFQNDPKKPRYGQPEYYPVKFGINETAQQTQEVHYSRVIEVHGRIVPAGATNQLNNEQRYWGLSVLQNTYERLQVLGGAVGNIATLIHEASVGKYKFKGLARILAAKDGPEQIRRRVETIDLTKSSYHSLFMDADEDFVRDNVSFAGIPEILYNFYMLIAADTGYPITRLFGVSPAGMNATGESDMRNYYDIVRAAQRSQLEPVLLRLVQIISEWKFGGKKEPYIEFNPLQQMSEKEKAELEKMQADKDSVIANTWHTYINDSVMADYEARFLQFGDSLNDIEPPEEDLPPVEPLPALDQDPGQPGAADNPAPDSNIPPGADNENALEIDKSGEDDDKKPGEENNTGPENDPPEGKPETDIEAQKGEETPEDINVRIAELEEKEELSEEEQQELDELKKQLKESNPGKGKKGKQ